MSLDQLPGLPEVFQGQHRIVVLAPHPDDESLGCATLLARAFADAGAHVVCMTDGSESHPGSREWPGPRLAGLRRNEMVRALQVLGGSEADLTWLGYRDTALDRADPLAVATDLIAIVEAAEARHVFAPAAEDHHGDHKATARIAQEMRKRRPDWSFYSYPIWSRWDDPDFDRNTASHDRHLLDPGAWGRAKRAAIEAHRSQLGQIVTDARDGFVLPAPLVAKFVMEPEVFWRMP